MSDMTHYVGDSCPGGHSAEAVDVPRCECCNQPILKPLPVCDDCGHPVSIHNDNGGRNKTAWCTYWRRSVDPQKPSKQCPCRRLA
ncbi:MAG: hypothetical protein RLZZ403_843 [Pseudomonadota bacterium]|jgi:predicted amidophosphoribosyltransferase